MTLKNANQHWDWDDIDEVMGVFESISFKIEGWNVTVFRDGRYKLNDPETGILYNADMGGFVRRVKKENVHRLNIPTKVESARMQRLKVFFRKVFRSET